MRRLSFLPNLIAYASWSYLAFIVALLPVIYWGGDRWWLATLILFGPRWVFLIPLVILLPFACKFPRQGLLPISSAFILVIWPLMGLCIPLGTPVETGGGAVVRVLSCNLQAGDFNPTALRCQIDQSRADIVALQECPKAIGGLVPEGWYILTEGDLAILSRYPLSKGPVLNTVQPPHQWPRANLLSCTIGIVGKTLSFSNVHLPSPRYGIQHLLDARTLINPRKSDFMKRETQYRQSTSKMVRSLVDSLPQPVVIVGDFNMPVESNIYRRDWSSYRNAFSSLGTGYGLSEWVRVFVIPFGIRIDHLLTSDKLNPVNCFMGYKVGSDHLPLIAEIMV